MIRKWLYRILMLVLLASLLVSVVAAAEPVSKKLTAPDVFKVDYVKKTSSGYLVSVSHVAYYLGTGGTKDTFELIRDGVTIETKTGSNRSTDGEEGQYDFPDYGTQWGWKTTTTVTFSLPASAEGKEHMVRLSAFTPDVWGGPYTVTDEVTFTPGGGQGSQKISIKDAVIKSIPDQVYTGKAVKPKVTVEYKGKKLNEGKDYSITYKNNKNVGKATVTVTGKGGYTGSNTATFNINPKPVSSFTLTTGGGALTVGWEKRGGIDGYEISYRLQKDPGGAQFTYVASANITKKTIKNLIKGKTYYVRIRTYKHVNGKKFFSAWTKEKCREVK